jgi:integrase
MKINFYLDKSHPDKKNEYMIFMSVHFFKRRLRIYTSLKSSLKNWDAGNQRIDEKVKGASAINSVLDSYEEEVKTKYAEALFNWIDPTIEYMKDNLSFIRGSEMDFFSLWDKFINSESRISGWTQGTVKRFNTTLKHLKEFQKQYNYKIEFNSINDSFIDKFLDYHFNGINPVSKEKNNFSNAFTEKNIKLLKWFLGWATRKGYNKNLKYQDFKVRLIKPKGDDNIVFLTVDEFLKVYALEISNEGLAQARDVFCFGCLTGLRYSDIANLKIISVHDDYMTVVTLKTRKSLHIPLNEGAKAILYKYNNLPGDKALPVISNQKFNDHLKQLGKLAKLTNKVTIINYIGSDRIETVHPKWTLLTSHVARKTFITMGVYWKIPIETIVNITGQSLDIVKRYYTIQDDQKRREMAKFNRLKIV